MISGYLQSTCDYVSRHKAWSLGAHYCARKLQRSNPPRIPTESMHVHTHNSNLGKKIPSSSATMKMLTESEKWTFIRRKPEYQFTA